MYMYIYKYIYIYLCTPRDMWKVSTTMELIESCALLSNEEQFSFYHKRAYLVTYERIRRCCEGMNVLRSTEKATEGILVAFQAKEKP